MVVVVVSLLTTLGEKEHLFKVGLYTQNVHIAAVIKKTRHDVKIVK
jgi:hypothetical protein